MNSRSIKLKVIGLICALLVACGGGGGGGGVSGIDPGGGIGGTGMTSSGSISAFGSIFVNGVEYETDSASISVDGDDATEAELGLGMVVTVIGTVNDDSVTGTAERVIYREKHSVTLEGEQVITSLTEYFSPAGQLLATRIEKKSDFVPGTTEVELKGTVENLTDTQFDIGDFTVDYSSADLTDVPNATLSEGMFVEVKGVLDGTLITASEVEEEDSLEDNFNPNDDVSVEGVVTDFVDNSNFRVAGVPVDASNAVFSPQGTTLQDGMVGEAEGSWDGTTLNAEEIELRGGDIRMRARVESVSTAEQTITLQFFGGTVTVSVDNQTSYEDGTGQLENMVLGDINAEDFVRVEALESDSGLLATDVKRDELDDDRLRAPVEAVDPLVSITLLGITYFTDASTTYEDGTLTEAQFYDLVQVGTVVQVDDDLVTDGTADEVDLED